MIDFNGALLISEAETVSEYKFTTPLSAPIARFFEEVAIDDVIVPSLFGNLSTHLRLLISQLTTKKDGNQAMLARESTGIPGAVT